MEPVVGAAVGAVMAELLKAVIDAKNKVSNFRLILENIEDTLGAIIPRLDEISDLNNKLNLQQIETKKLISLLNNGKALVLKCSKISTYNFIRKLEHSKELLNLDNTLLRYFNTILPLDQSRDIKEILVMVRELNMKPAIGNNQSESGNPKKDSGSGSREVGKLHQDFEMKLHVKLNQDSMKDEHMQLYLDSDEEEAVRALIQWQLQEVENNKFSKRGNSSQKYKEIKQSAMKYDIHLDLQDLGSESEVLFHGTYGTSYRCNKIENKPLIIKRLKEVKVGEWEFTEHIKFLKKIWQQHPNIMFPSDYYFSEKEKLLIYDSEVLSDNLFQSLHAHPFSVYYRKHSNNDVQVMPFRSQIIPTKVDGRQGNPLEWKARVKIALGTARGICHLHSFQLIHGNIESSNVLITREYDGIISDYGFNTIMNLSATTSKTSGYCAPEFISTGEATEESDVYSFGIMLLEIILEQSRPDQSDIRGLAYKYIREGCNSDIFAFELRGSYEKEKKMLLEIAVMCVDSEPNKRPNMGDVVKMIKKMSPEPNNNEFFDP